MRLVGYARVSTDAQAEEGLSLAVQRTSLKSYADALGHQLVATFEDSASGKDLKRSGLQGAFDHLDQGEADGLLVMKLDRLTRSVRDLADIVAQRFSGGSKLLSVKEQIDTSTSNGNLMLNIMMSVAQWEREVISERTAEALALKRERGQRAGEIPFGMRLADDGVHLEPHPGEQRAIELIQELRAAGRSLRWIVRELEARSVPARGSRWHLTTVARIVKRSSRAPRPSTSTMPEPNAPSTNSWN